MIKAWRFIKRWWWVVLIVAGAILGFIFGFRSRSKDDEAAPPDFVEKAKAEKEAIDAQAAVEKIKIKSKANAKRARLDEISKIQNVRERRARLAEFMQRL